MNTHDDDLRARLGHIRGARYKGFFAEVHSAARNEGYIGVRSRSPRASRFHPVVFWPRPRRRLVSAIKIRIGAGYGAAVGDDVGARRELALAARSDLPIKAQITAMGTTWLDRQLVSCESVSLSEVGFGRDVRQALQARTDHLAAEGLTGREGQRVIFTRQLIETLRRRELNAVAANIASKTGLEYYPAAGAAGMSRTGIKTRAHSGR